MLGVEDYGSSSESEGEHASNKASTSTRAVKSATTKAQPTPKAKRPPKKITIGLPNLPPPKDYDEEHEHHPDEPAAKKPRLEKGAAMSSLLSMLPAPKKANPVLPPPERVLGGGARPSFTFNAASSTEPYIPEVSKISAHIEDEDTQGIDKSSTASTPKPVDSTSSPFAFVPTSVSRGRANISVEEGSIPAVPKPPVTSAPAPKKEPAVDFFSLTGPSGSKTKPSVSSGATVSSAPSVSISSAPEIPTFTPPEPTPTDQYPGYYQLPSGTWAAYDAEYYGKFVKKWQAEYDAHVRALEKGQAKGFEGWDRGTVEDVDAQKEMERAKRDIKDLEERKALTNGAGSEPAKPRMTMNPSKLSGIARSRHQLSTLLNEAYMNREAMEEKIAEGRRNRKEAGNKYGF